RDFHVTGVQTCALPISVRPRQGVGARPDAGRRADPGRVHPGHVVPVVQAGTRLTLDANARRFRGDRVLLGGSPLRLIRLSSTGAGYLRDWVAGQPVGDRSGERRLAERLVAAGLMHPRPSGGHYSARDVTLVVPVKDDASGAAAVGTASEGLNRVVVDDGSAAPLPD